MSLHTRRSHYEMAFEAYLNLRGTPFVAVEDAPHATRGRLGTKSFDYIVYPAGARPCLVDVKGRKTRRRKSDGDCRAKTWVTRRDVEGLGTWRTVFGAEYTAAFVFAYWLADDPELWDGIGGGAQRVFGLAGRRYAFYLVPLSAYSRHFKRLSKRWDTVSIQRNTFQAISRELASVWPAAPC